MLWMDKHTNSRNVYCYLFLHGSMTEIWAPVSKHENRSAGSSVSEDFRVYMSAAGTDPSWLSLRRRIAAKNGIVHSYFNWHFVYTDIPDGSGGCSLSGPSRRTLTSGLLCHFSSLDRRPHRPVNITHVSVLFRVAFMLEYACIFKPFLLILLFWP